MNQLTKAGALSPEQFEGLCRDLSQEFANVLRSRVEYSRTDVVTAVLMRLHEGIAAQMPQEVRRSMAFDMAAYAGDLMAPPKPLSSQTVH